MVVRVAATGRAATPPLFETLAVLGKEVVRRRLRRAIAAEGVTRPRAANKRIRMANPPEPAPASETLDFIREIVSEDVRSGKHQTVVTRFPPEPNGYLHVGHAKSICLNFGVAQEFGGRTNLRFDDTNPTKEEQEYIDSIKADVRWLGFDWGENLYPRLRLLRPALRVGGAAVQKGLAYVDDLTADQIREHRGHADRARQGEPVPQPSGRRRTSTSSGACARASSRTARACCGRRSTWPPATSTCATP